MILREFTYSELFETPESWILDNINLLNINLIVGKNGAGKTRSINVINSLATVLTNTSKIAFKDGNYKAVFESSDAEIFKIEIKIKDFNVVCERLLINDKEFINRKNDGSGSIMSMKTNDLVEFQIPTDELVVSRRDLIQYPFLESLYQWAILVRRFRFHEQMKNKLVIIENSGSKESEFNLRETDKVQAIFLKGDKNHPNTFKERIISDFNQIGYSISDIYIGEQVSVVFQNNPGLKLQGLVVKENDRDGITDQNSMSDGMFRALSIIIHFVFYKMEKLAGCILIDDIGEGLDFERATNLIRLLISEAEMSNVQLIMSTNDKFVMNNTDLKYWQIISRDGGKVNFYNQENSADIFDQFKFTGLNNFDLFTTEFFKEGFQTEHH